MVVLMHKTYLVEHEYVNSSFEGTGACWNSPGSGFLELGISRSSVGGEVASLPAALDHSGKQLNESGCRGGGLQTAVFLFRAFGLSHVGLEVTATKFQLTEFP